VGEGELAQGREQVAVALQPEGVAAVEAEGEGLGHPSQFLVGRGRQFRGTDVSGPGRPGERGLHSPQGLGLARLAVAVEIEPDAAERERQRDLAGTDACQRFFRGREVDEERGEHRPRVGVGDLRRVGIRRHGQPQKRHHPGEPVIWPESPVAMERLAKPLDCAEKLRHPEAEAGLVVIGMSGEAGLQGRDPLDKATVEQESLGQRRLIGPHRRRHAGDGCRQHGREDSAGDSWASRSETRSLIHGWHALVWNEVRDFPGDRSYRAGSWSQKSGRVVRVCREAAERRPLGLESCSSQFSPAAGGPARSRSRA
jgi:hypothetical protein